MKLSIVIPVYNLENHIHITLYSLLMQGRNDFEVIIVDDGSTDNSLSMAKGFIDENNASNFKVIAQENAGVSSARNMGMAQACGEYILFLDGDDYVSHDIIDVIYDKLEVNSPDIIYWGYNQVNENNKTIHRFSDVWDGYDVTRSGIEVLTNIIMTKEIKTCTGNVAYRSNLLRSNNLEYMEGCTAGEDLEFIYKAISNAVEVVFINKVLSYYVQRQGSISNSYNIRRFDSIAAIERVCVYLEERNHVKLIQLAAVIKKESILIHYMGTFRLCMEQLVQYRSLSPRKARKVIETDIEKSFPKLNSRIRNLAQDYNTGSMSTKAQIKLFLVSPLMYYYVGNLKNRMRMGV